MPAPYDTVSPARILTAVALLALVIFLSLAFQMMQVMRDRDTLHQVIAQQDKPLEESRKVQAQLSALALGTKKLADGGDKSAAAIIARMQQVGISVGGPNGAPATTAPAAAPPAAPAPQQP